VSRLLWDTVAVSTATSIPRRTLERLRASGSFPAPDMRVGKRPYWKPGTIRAWVESGGRVVASSKQGGRLR
jgi:hypothetical protein